MALITFLGASFAVPDSHHGNTHFLVKESDSLILVDCAGDGITRLQQIDVQLADITDLIITHFHPDHDAAGIPLFLMAAWLMGRKIPLTVHGLPHTLDCIKANMDLYAWQEWPGLFPVRFVPIENREFAVVTQTPALEVTASPVRHSIPNVCLKFKFHRSGKSILYSSDTEPCPEVEHLASNVDMLLHEATGPFPGHSSAAQAAEVARKALVRALPVPCPL